MISRSLDGHIVTRMTDADRHLSLDNMEQLLKFVDGPDRDLVFFVGAGISSIKTGLPKTQDLITQFVTAALAGANYFPAGVVSTLLHNLESDGFEITLNDLWQICPQAVTGIFDAFALAEEAAAYNEIHRFLAWWINTGGVVITTNYDRLIERARDRTVEDVGVRYSTIWGRDDTGPNSFATWHQDLAHGKALFKVHGSLDEIQSCLGVLEHVGTRITGYRAELISEVIKERPACFVGWRGADPDIPALLANLAHQPRQPNPIFWILSPNGPRTLTEKIQEVPQAVRWLASDHPIRADAGTMFRELVTHLGLPAPHSAEETLQPLPLDSAYAACRSSGLLRFVGIVLRRSGRFTEALQVLDAAANLGDTGELIAARQEKALLYWARNDAGDKRLAMIEMRQIMSDARTLPDLALRTTFGFGLYSMTANELLDWLEAAPVHDRLFHLPRRLLACRRAAQSYARSIEELERHGAELPSVGLHLALYSLFVGRIRLELRAKLGCRIRPVRRWILRPFEHAQAKIEQAGDIHLHSRIDVLSYRALALATFGQCDEAQAIAEQIDRLYPIMSDKARAAHWRCRQRPLLEAMCPGIRS